MTFRAGCKPFRLFTQLILVFALCQIYPLKSQSFQENKVYSNHKPEQLERLLQKAMDNLYTSTDSALIYTNQAWKIANTLDEEIYKAKVHMQYGILYDILSDYDSAVYHYHHAADIGEKGDSLPSLLQDVYYYLSILYEPIGHTNKAMEYAQKSLKIALEQENWSDAAITATSIADVYWNEQKYAQAIENYRKAIEYAPEGIDDIFLFTAYTNMGTIYIDWDRNLDSVKYFFDECYKMIKDMPEEDLEYHMHAEANLFKYYFRVEDYSKAKYYLDRAYKYIPILNNPYLTSFFYRYYADYYSATDQMDSAYFYVTRHYHLEDSVNGFDVKKNLNEIEAKYATAKKEKHIVQLQNARKIDQARKQTLLAIIIFTAILLLVTFIFYLTNRKKSIKLAEQNEIIQQSYNEIENLIRESHHRIKNNLQVVSSLLKMQSKNVESEEARASLIEAFNRVKTIAVLHQKLQGSQTFTMIHLREFIDQLTDNIRGSIASTDGHVSIYTDVDELEVDTDQSISLGLIINELITNSLKYAFENAEGEIEVSLHQKEDTIELKVTDNGKGFPEHFNPLNGSSLGYKIVQSLVTKLKGKLITCNHEGALVNISFPYVKAAA